MNKDIEALKKEYMAMTPVDVDRIPVNRWQYEVERRFSPEVFEREGLDKTIEFLNSVRDLGFYKKGYKPDN